MKREPAAGRTVVALRRTYKAASATHKSTDAAATVAANAAQDAGWEDVASAAAMAAGLEAIVTATAAAEAKADLKAAEKCKGLSDLLTSDRPAVRQAALLATAEVAP
jgi:hypothetical protein